MNEVIFNGSQKEFFKSYPIENRSFDTVYVLCNKGTETKYRFVGSLGENKFTRVDAMENPNIDEYIMKIHMLETEISQLKSQEIVPEKACVSEKPTRYDTLLNRIKQKRTMYGKRRFNQMFN